MKRFVQIALFVLLTLPAFAGRVQVTDLNTSEVVSVVDEAFTVRSGADVNIIQFKASWYEHTSKTD